MEEDADMEFRFKSGGESSTQEIQDDTEQLFQVKETAKSLFQTKKFEQAYLIYS